MKPINIVFGAALALLLSGPAAADSGIHAHPHVVRPLLDLDPAQGLALTLAVGGLLIAAIETLSAGRRRAG